MIFNIQACLWWWIYLFVFKHENTTGEICVKNISHSKMIILSRKCMNSGILNQSTTIDSLSCVNYFLARFYNFTCNKASTSDILFYSSRPCQQPPISASSTSPYLLLPIRAFSSPPNYQVPISTSASSPIQQVPISVFSSSCYLQLYIFASSSFPNQQVPISTSSSSTH